MVGYIGYFENGALVSQEQFNAFDTSEGSGWYQLPSADVWNCTIHPSPYQSWVLNKSKGKWEAPSPVPQDGKVYAWDESALSWVEVIQQDPPAA